MFFSIRSIRLRNYFLFQKKIVSLFRKHGGIELNTPLLSPYVKTTRNNAVRLMTTSGGVVVLPHDLRMPFIKHVSLNGIQLMRRYTVDRVYREKKGFNFHPKQLYECAFDIVTPSAEGRSSLIDAELISMAYELTHIIPVFNQRNLSLRVNHTSMLRAIMLHHNVPVEKYSDIFGAVLDFIDRRISKFQLHSIVTTMLETSKHSATTLIDVLLTEFEFTQFGQRTQRSIPVGTQCNGGNRTCGLTRTWTGSYGNKSGMANAHSIQ